MNTDKFKSVLFLSTLITLVTLACNVGQSIVPTPTGVPSLMPTVVLRATPSPTRAAQFAPPPWWDTTAIALPKGVEFIGDATRAAWSTRDTKVDGLRDFFLREASAAGFQSFVVTQSPGAIYDVLLVRGQAAYALNLTLGSDTTIITASRVGVMRLQVSGVANVQVDLPLRSRVDTSPGSEVSIGTALPSPQCAGCEYFINVHIAPFKGVGNYDAKPGISIIDVELVPGGDHIRDNYRWAIGGCAVVVRETSGSFDCKQLQNIADQNKRVDVSGSWTQPADGK